MTKERTIPAGTKIYRTSVNPNEDKGDGSIYVSYLDVDRNHYKGGYIRAMGKADIAYEYSYELKEDLKIPSREKQQQIVSDVVKSNEKYMREAMESWVDMVLPKGSMERLEMDTKIDGGVKSMVDNMVNDASDRPVSELAFTVCQSLDLAKDVKKEVISRLQDEGYNAMVDEASVGGQNGWAREGYDPLIVFDAKESLNKTDVRAISKEEEYYSNVSDSEWRNKAFKKAAAWSDF